MVSSTVLKMLREDIRGELCAINQYQEHIESAGDKKIKKLLEHIILDEKEHLAELTKLLIHLDKNQHEKFKKDGL